ncbi:ABC transporter ATP-binding protein [Candidatus Fermentibacteria bacterium]|nr:ABC transporter ATP-binding protein [Candidatus Fermentibacteria bacterium]
MSLTPSSSAPHAADEQSPASQAGLAAEVRDLWKTFGEVHALAGVSFEVGSGELFGLLGPNGAGKTTTIRILTGLSRCDSGSVRVAGIDCTGNPRAALRHIGVVPDESNLYPELTGFENLCFCASLYGIGRKERRERAHSLLERFGLAEAARRRFAGYSKGMKRKLTIAAGLIHRPEILFLDEPTTGIDVTSAREIRQLLSELHSAGTTILLTTHYIEEAERLCDRIAFMVSGRIAKVDTVRNLLEPLQGLHAMDISFSGDAGTVLAAVTRALPEMAFTRTGPSSLRASASAPFGIGALLRAIEAEGGEVLEARRIRPSLEEVFVRETSIGPEAMKREKERQAKPS